MGYKVPCSGSIKNTSMSHSPTERAHDHGINMHIHPVSQLRTKQHTNRTPCINEGHGERQDITEHDKMSKQRPHDHEASPMIQQWDSLILIDDDMPCISLACRISGFTLSLHFLLICMFPGFRHFPALLVLRLYFPTLRCTSHHFPMHFPAFLQLPEFQPTSLGLTHFPLHPLAVVPLSLVF